MARNDVLFRLEPLQRAAELMHVKLHTRLLPAFGQRDLCRLGEGGPCCACVSSILPLLLVQRVVGGPEPHLFRTHPGSIHGLENAQGEPVGLVVVDVIGR